MKFRYLAELAYFRISTPKNNEITQAITRFDYIHVVGY